MTTSSSLRTTDILARRLYASGCRYAFGMPGGEVLTLVDSLERAGIKFVLTCHENSAGFMAEGVHHCDGAPAILVATLGPGAMNTMNVVANASQDHVPLIVLTGCVDSDVAESYTHQVIDHAAIFSPLVLQSFRLTPESADIISDKAISLSMEGQMGPVHIDIPISVASARVRSTATLTASRRRPATPAKTGIVAPYGETLRDACSLLRNSERPLLIVGFDVVRENAGGQLKRFAEKFDVPVITTYKAKGIISESHPLCLGGAGLSPLADKHLLGLVRSSDLVLCVGYDPIEMRDGWRDPWSLTKTKVIDISSVIPRHCVHRSTLTIVGHTGATLDALTSGVKKTKRKVWRDGKPARVRKRLKDAFSGDNDEWGASAVISEVWSCFPSNAIATVDSGAHRILLSQMWECSRPRSLLQSTGFCTMGCSVPLAIGAKLRSPDRPVVSFTGDAGFLMVMSELVVALRVAPITIIVFVDNALSLIEMKQRFRRLPSNGVRFCSPDFSLISTSFGGISFDVSSRHDLRLALDSSFSSSVFSVISAHIDSSSYIDRF